jgi:hypothetical protein
MIVFSEAVVFVDEVVCVVVVVVVVDDVIDVPCSLSFKKLLSLIKK